MSGKKYSPVGKGYLEVLSDNKSVRLKNKKPGRPPIINSMDIKKTIRMDHETATKLDNYCQTNNIKLSEAIRIAINKL